MNTINLDQVFDRINTIGGLATAIFSYIFGVHWIFFVGFLVLNIVDYITGLMKAHLTHKTNSQKGFAGLLKKFGYWIIIMLSFGMSVMFMEFGKVINVDLGITTIFGYFVLITMIINEFRSIMENLVEAGYHPPKILTRGLEVASKIVEKKTDDLFGEDEEDDSQ